MTTEKTDSEVIDKIVNGDKEKYEILIRKYNRRLYRVAKAMLWDEGEIEDAIQEAYIKAYYQLSKFKKQSAFSTWLIRILINECLVRKKATQKRAHHNQENKMKGNVEYFNAEKNMMNTELKGLLENAIARLPEKYRAVFVMSEVENMSVPETTAALEITATNMKARLSRAKEMLRNDLLTGYPMADLLDFNLIRCDRIVKNVLAKI